MHNSSQVLLHLNEIIFFPFQRKLNRDNMDLSRSIYDGSNTNKLNIFIACIFERQ